MTEIFQEGKEDLRSYEARVESSNLVMKEVEKIESEDIKRFIYDVFNQVDLKFWVAPASSTGKYHPEEDNGEGGLVRHVIKGCAVAEQFARRAQFTQREMDITMAAVLLHDTCKNGVVWGRYTDYTHGKIAAEWLAHFPMEDTTARQMICDAVRYHMAPWCYVVSPFEDRQFSREEMQANWEEVVRGMNPSRIERAVQEADYWSSRKSMSFFPGATTNWRHDVPEN